MTDPVNEDRKAIGHEPIETNVRAVWRTGVIIVGVVAGSFLLIFGIMKWFSVSEAGISPGQARKADPAYGDMLPIQELRLREFELLSSYEWVNESAGVARIPIERAMEIVAQTGVSTKVGTSKAAAPTTDEEPAEVEEAPNGSEGNPE